MYAPKYIDHGAIWEHTTVTTVHLGSSLPLLLSNLHIVPPPPPLLQKLAMPLAVGTTVFAIFVLRSLSEILFT